MRRTPAEVAARREAAARRRAYKQNSRNMVLYKNVPVRSIPVSRRSYVVPGITRTGGFWGRMNGPNAPEMKFIDSQLTLPCTTTAAVSSTFATGACCLIAQGDTESQRDGRNATILSVFIKGNCQFTAGTATVGAGTVYMYLIQDRQANGAFPAVTDIFTGSNPWELVRNLEYNDRFRILAYKTVSLKSMAGVSGAYSSDIRPFQIFKKLAIPITWASTTGAITEIRQNNIVMVWGTDAVPGGTGTIAVDAIIRVRFKG